MKRLMLAILAATTLIAGASTAEARRWHHGYDHGRGYYHHGRGYYGHNRHWRHRYAYWHHGHREWRYR